MKSLFNPEARQEIINRIENLKPDAQRQWGKMDVAQMLAHCNEVMKVAKGELEQPGTLFSRIIGPIVRRALYNDTPFPKNSPTAPYFKIIDDKDFDKEKQNLISQVNQFYDLGIVKMPVHKHPFFGKITNSQWGLATYKHLNHHLEQFSS